MKSIFTLVMFVFFLYTITTNGYANSGPNNSIGFIKSLSGEVYLSNKGEDLKAVVNMKLTQGDTIKTGHDGAVGLILEDDTVISLGPGSEIQVESFAFYPAEKQLSFIARILSGTFSFITGQIAKLAPEKMILETPDATLGVRGTKFLVKVE